MHYYACLCLCIITNTFAFGTDGVALLRLLVVRQALIKSTVLIYYDHE